MTVIPDANRRVIWPGPIGTWLDISPAGVSLTYNPSGTPPPANFGMQTIALSAASPQTLYVGTCNQGIWKSTNRGASWVKCNTGTLGADLDAGRNWTMAVDPTDANIVYTVAGFGTITQGVFKSTDGGVNWVQKFTSTEFTNATADVYAIAINPVDHLHLLVTFHSGWAGGADAGVAESLDGGTTWTLHGPITGIGTGQYAFFLGKNDGGAASSAYWMLATQSNGYHRTTNSGTSWTQVYSTDSMQHGACQMYRASTDALYIGASVYLLRSTDNGQTWARITTGLPVTADGFNAVIGDGTTLYAMLANTGEAGAFRSYYASPESDGTSWAAFNGQTFVDGPMAFACDAVGGYVYSSNWTAGVLKLRVR